MSNSLIIKMLVPVGLGLFLLIMISGNLFPLEYNPALASVKKNKSLLAAAGSASLTPAVIPVPELDKALYDKKMEELANNIVHSSTSPASTTPHLWPVKTVYPKAGAILPFKRIVAYYGNLYSTRMGVLGEYSEAEVFRRLNIEIKKWEIADPKTPVQPALHYIVATAQGSAGSDGMYRFRMPDEQIDKVLAMAKKINAIVFLDIQVGLSSYKTEIPHLEKYLKMPNVHLGLDPEFSMKTGAKPGTVIGTVSSADINYAINYLATLVKENNLPPKILIIHRFTQPMVTGYKNIKLVPEVQFVMDMDGWGTKERKIDSYQAYVQKEPVQFTGFKLFYKNDFRQAGSEIMTPKQLMKLQPCPIYIQYQ
ncbi:MAG: hypothetical protein NTV48_02860 [Candidatus Vogelbacteria bacterium]|nr:hypothetical protein [Candidatus Vogelbacteria bacterium]